MEKESYSISDMVISRKPAKISIKKYATSQHEKFYDITSWTQAKDLFPEVKQEIHTHDFYLMVWFFEGKGTHMVDFREYEIKKNSVFFLSPSQVHQFIGLNKFEAYAIVFSPDMMDLISEPFCSYLKQYIFGAYNTASVCTLREEDSVIPLQRLNCIIEEFNKGPEISNHNYYLMYLTALLIMDMIRYGTFDKKECSMQSNEFETFKKFTDLLEKNFTTMSTAKEYAEMLHISLSKLDRDVKLVTQKTASKLIDERRIKEIKIQLAMTSKTIGEIGRAMGFEDESNFTKYFVRLAGMTPSDFRRLNKKA